MGDEAPAAPAVGAAVPQQQVINIVQPLFGNLVPFDPREQSITGWYQVFQEFCTCNAIAEEPQPVNNVVPHNQRRAIFLTNVGPRAYEILRKATLPDRPNTRALPELMAILREKFEPPGLIASNRYELSCRNQQESESVAEYISVLNDLASKCNYGEFLPQALKDRLIAGIKYPDIRSKLLGIQDLTWDRAKEVALQDEQVKLQSKTMAQSTNIHQVQRQKSANSFPKPNYPQRSPAYTKQSQPSNPNTISQSKRKFNPCHRCGKLHDVKTCPARTWTCHKCQKIGHAAQVCRSSTAVHGVQLQNQEEESVEEEAVRLLDFKHIEVLQSELPQQIHSDTPESILIVSQGKVSDLSDKPESAPLGNSRDLDVESESVTVYVKDVTTVSSVANSPALYSQITVNSKSIQMEIDNGSGASLMSLDDFHKHFPEVEIQNSNTILRSVTGLITTAGEANMCVSYASKDYNLPLILCKDTPQFIPLLGRSWLDAMKPSWRDMLSLQPVPIYSKVQVTSPPSLERLKTLFPAPFATNDDSCIRGYTAHITLKENAIPVFSRAYQVPYGLLDAVNKHIERQVEAGKMIPVSQAEWASPAVIVQKEVKGNQDGIRYCVDFKKTLNPSMILDRHPIPNPESACQVLAGGKFFTSLDLSDAYTQLKLDSESQNLCVVNTHRGLFKYTRLIYGLASAPSIFQNCLDVILAGLEGVICFIDNIAIMGRTLSECVERTMLVLARLDKHNVRLRQDKCEWFVPQIEYLGYVINAEGRTPTPNLHKDILEAPPPSDLRSLRSFLGLISFYSKFIPDFSTVTQPLRKLTEVGVPFNFSEECETAFKQCKELLTSNSLLVHYNPDLPIVVLADASPVGVGAVLAHVVEENGREVEKPILFASSSLTKAQQNYAQIDREALACVFAVTKFYRYLWGRRFTLVTDNAAIQRIFHPERPLPIRTDHRLQHWATLLQPYDYKLVHRSSKFLAPADALSRLPGKSVIQDTHLVFTLKENLPVTSEVIAQETQANPILREVLRITQVGWPNHMSGLDPALSPYFNVRHSLTIRQGCLLQDGRVVVPPVLQKQILDMLHQGHPGVVRTKLLARSLVWWPGLGQDIETQCQLCNSCAIVNFKPQKEYVPWPPAKYPFERVHIDFFHYQKENYLIYCDSFSKWLTVVPMLSLTAQAVIETLSGIYSTWGLPETSVSDNGPPFDSNAYVQFCTSLNITVKHSCVGHPEGNGLAERGVQIAKKALSKLVMDKPDQNESFVESLPFKVQKFLFNYRNTPTTTLRKSPNEILLNFKPRTLLTQLLPMATPKSLPTCHSHFREGDPVIVRLHKTPTKGVIVRQIGPNRFHVSIEGVVKQAHFNQLARAI